MKEDPELRRITRWMENHPEECEEIEKECKTSGEDVLEVVERTKLGDTEIDDEE